jgi:hypothetical protein
LTGSYFVLDNVKNDIVVAHFTKKSLLIT